MSQSAQSLELIEADPVPAAPPVPTFCFWGYRYCGIDVTYWQDSPMFGTALLFPITGVLSWIGNRRRRLEAQRAAAPQWHPLGAVVVTVYDDHFIVSPINSPAGVFWIGSIAQLAITPQAELDVHVVGDAPFRFAGPRAADLAERLRVRRPRSMMRVTPTR